MRIILKQDIPKLGQAGEMVTVKDGYARNYLIPEGLAMQATSGARRMLDHERRMREVREMKQVRAAREYAKQIRKISCTIPKQVGENDRLFGSVTPTDIVEALTAEGVQVSKNQIVLEEPIKALGIYPVLIKLHPQVETRLKVWVVRA